MRFLPDTALYTNTDYCLQFLRALPVATPAAPARQRYHFYWYGTFGRKQAFALKSFLATQDLAHADVWLWLDAAAGYANHAENPLLKPLLPFLQVRRFDPVAEAAGTPLAGRTGLFAGRRLALRANYMRYSVLHNYGGIYCDLDLMFLRDLGPFLHNPQFAGEFCYPWAGQPFANNAVLRMRAGSAALTALMAHCVRIGSLTSRASLVFADHAGLDLLVLPCPLFDPHWLHRDGVDRYPGAPFEKFAEFFRPFNLIFRRRQDIESFRDFFPGAFAYHWHNYWDAPELPNSYFGLFEAEIDDLLRARLGLAPPAR